MSESEFVPPIDKPLFALVFESGSADIAIAHEPASGSVFFIVSDRDLGKTYYLSVEEPGSQGLLRALLGAEWEPMKTGRVSAGDA